MSPGTSEAWAAGLPGSTPLTIAPDMVGCLNDFASFVFMSCNCTPIQFGTIFGSCNAAAAYFTLLDGSAKPSPMEPCVELFDSNAVLIPITLPLQSSSGPPELPGFIAAAVWM